LFLLPALLLLSKLLFALALLFEGGLLPVIDTHHFFSMRMKES